MARMLNKKVVGVLTLLGMLVLAAIGFALILNLPSQDPAKYAAEAKQLQEKGEYSRAMQTYARAYSKDPGRSPEYLVSAAECAIEDGKLVFARECLDQALLRDSHLKSALKLSTELEFELARMGGEKLQWKRVLDVARRLLEVDAESPAGHHAAGSAYLVLQSDDESYVVKGEASLKRALELDPNNVEIVKDVAMESWVEATRKKLAGSNSEAETMRNAALSSLTAAVTRFEESGAVDKAVDLKELRVRLLLQRGMKEEALALLEELVQKETMRASGHLLLGQVYASATVAAGEPDYAKAAAVLEEGRKIDPKNGEVRYLLGEVYRRLGKPEEAQACYRQALEEIPYKDHFRSYRDNRMRIEFITELFQQELDRATQAAGADEAAPKAALAAAEGWIAKLKEEVDEQSLWVRYMNAALYRARGEIVAATSEAETASRMVGADRHFPLQTLLADVYMRRQQWGVARKALESALVIRPDAPGVVILLARVHLELGEPEEVVRYLKPIAPGPMRDFLLKNEQAAKLRIRAYEMLGQLDEARKENERLPQDKPEDVVRRAFLLQAEGQAKKAEDLLKEALDQDPENAELLVAIVQFYVSNNQLEQGQALVQQRLAKDPGNLLYRRLEVLVMPAQGEDAARDAKILEILKEEKDDFTRAMSLAEFHRTRRNPEQELKHLDEAEKIHPDHPDVIERRFRAALVAEDWERADRYVTKYRELNFDGTEGRIAAGRLALAKGTALRAEGNENQAAVELQTAAKLLKEGLEKQPSFSLGWVFLADAQLKMNQIEEGRAALERALDIDPTNGLACRAMTQIAIVRNDEPMEAKYLALAAKFLPNDPWVKQRLQLRREKDNPQQGILERENIRRQQPDNLENLVPLARLYGDPKVADYDQAVEAFQRALELSKDDLVLAREIAMFLGSEAVNRPADGEALLKRLLDNAESEPEAPAPGSEPRTPATGPNNRKALIAVYLGQFYEAQKTLSLADRHFRMAVSWDPSPDIFILGAEFYTRNNRSRDALEYYERALKQIDDNSESARSVRARMIGLLLTAGDLEMAQQKIDEFLQRYPDEAQGLVFVGAIHRMAGDIEKSKAAFDGFLAKRPDDALVLWQRGQLYMLMARWQAAIDDLTKSKVNKPDSFGYQHRIALASALIEVGRDQEAVAGLRSILNEHPDEQGVAEALVGVYLRLRPAQYADAEDLIVTYMRGHPKEVRWPTLLGQLGAQSADWKKAVRGYEAAAELARYGGGSIPALFSAYRHAGQPADIIRFSEEKLSAQVLDSQPAVLATLAWAYSQVKDEKKCFDTYDRALAMARDFPTQSMIVTEMAQVFGKEAVLERCQGRAESDPDNVSNLEVYAHLLFMNGKLEEAIKVCERIAGLATNDTDAVFAAVAQGMLLDGLGRYAEAKTKYEEALQRDPEQSVALNNLAYLLTERLDHPAEALPYARRAYRRSPNDPGVLDTLGWTLAKSNQLGEAVGMLLRALEIDRRNLAATYHLGLVHELRGELEEAKERLTSAKELAEAQGDNRTLPKIIEALNRLEKRG